MPNLRSYTREALLALPPSAELDELVHKVRGRIGQAPQYSKDVGLVGVMLVKLREHWPLVFLRGDAWIKDQSAWVCGRTSKHKEQIVGVSLPHVCALALVLAAWEKEPR